MITILAILGTIGFISIQGYSKSARDSSRVSNLVNLAKAMEFLTAGGGTLPLPDASMLTITASGTTIGYQGYAGTNVLRTLSLGGKFQDPVDGKYYTYLTNATRTKYQILNLLEDSGNPSLVVNEFPGIGTAYAGTYDLRYLLTKGNQLGILVGTGSSLNQPAQELYSGSFTGVDVVNTTTPYTVVFSGQEVISGTGVAIGAAVQIAINNEGVGFGAPAKCASGFVPVPGNKDFNQPGFCVAKYEMSYVDADTPDSSIGATDWNTMHYVPGKAIVSIPNKHPIADVSQTQAIAACASLGTGYHLITNNEWMTITRNIEANGDNWSTGVVGSGYIYNSLSNDATRGCGGQTNAVYTSLPRNWAAKTGGSDTANLSSARTTCDQKRQHELSNGQIVWDISGNVWEHVHKGNTLDTSLYADASLWVSNACSGLNGWASFSGNDGVAACSYSNGYSYANQ